MTEVGLIFRDPDPEALLRREWWLNHACPAGSWYGDDGEMSCGACRLDFKRMPLPVLYERVTFARMEAAALAMREMAFTRVEAGALAMNEMADKLVDQAARDNP